METELSGPTKPMVLLVDDDEGTLVSIAAILESVQAEIVTASTFEAAWSCRLASRAGRSRYTQRNRAPTSLERPLTDTIPPQLLAEQVGYALGEA
jgi:hypothetical protein